MNEKLSWTFAAVAAASGGAVFLADRIEAAADPQMKRALACALIFWWVTCPEYPALPLCFTTVAMHEEAQFSASSDGGSMAHAGLFFWSGW